jgi:hypothetical protein
MDSSTTGSENNDEILEIQLFNQFKRENLHFCTVDFFVSAIFLYSIWARLNLIVLRFPFLTGEPFALASERFAEMAVKNSVFRWLL